MISLTINDRPIEVPEGATILDAARKLGIGIPTLCHYEGVKPYGGCRLCLVEVTQGTRTQLTASCTYPTAPGLKVRTDTEEVQEARRFVMDLLLSRCPEVPALQEMARQLGLDAPGFPKGESDCILCGKCVRVCHELQGVGAIGIVGRGAKRQVTTPFGEVSDICRTCGACAFVCPTGHLADFGKISGKTPIPRYSEFNMGLNTRGNVYRQYPQAVPAAPAIDRQNCIQILTGDCGVCAQACVAGAIDYQQHGEELSLEVGSVILAPGFKPYDPSQISPYGFGKYPNVVTSLQFERMLSPGGPFQGHIKRASDGREPKKIAWIQCVGMRDEREGYHAYCSNFCCMASLKQGMIAKEHIGSDLDTAVFLMDMRTPRKDFEKYYARAEDLGARLIRSRVHTVSQVNGGDLNIRYLTEAGDILEENFEMVVLSTGLVITPETVELARNLGVKVNHNRFMDTHCFEPVTTSRRGVFSCGAFTGPKDIPQSVMEGSAAAAAATRPLAAARGALLKKKEYPAETEVVGEEPRVGVFVCNCGLNIGGVADVPALVEYAREIPQVAYAQSNLFTCSQDAQNQMAQVIREQNLNRVVVAACSPSTHQPIFQDMLRTASLNKYLFEMANIRNQCTWVHLHEPAAATEKCKDLIRMAVAKARLLEPLEYITVPVNHKALVIGGGVTGMIAALALADQGYEVHLAERKERLGGNAAKLHTTWRGGPVGPRLDALIARVLNHPKIKIHYRSIVVGVSGTVGNFRTRLSQGQEIDHGIVIVAIGGEPYRPKGEYLYKRHPDVLLSLDLDQEIMEDTDRLRQAQAVAFIQCVGSRIPERPYCNKVCCAHAVENALKLKDRNPDLEVYVLYRDMRTYGEREMFYTMAREAGVIFIRYEVDDPPQVTEAQDGRIKITVTDHVLRRPVELTVDLLTLATAIIPHQNAPLAELYKIPLNAEGFFTEAHAKIKPVEASSEGIYLAGLCHYPKPLQESVSEALATASRANTILSRDYLELDAVISNPIDENCDGCAFCVDSCPFKAITLLEYMKQGGVKKTVEVNPVLCKGCGSCMATCPKQGIFVCGFTLAQLGAQVDAALGVA